MGFLEEVALRSGSQVSGLDLKWDTVSGKGLRARRPSKHARWAAHSPCLPYSGVVLTSLVLTCLWNPFFHELLWLPGEMAILPSPPRPISPSSSTSSSQSPSLLDTSVWAPLHSPWPTRSRDSCKLSLIPIPATFHPSWNKMNDCGEWGGRR